MDRSTVLFVDDDKFMLNSLRRSLRAEGYTILLAHSALEALNILASAKVDVLVSDEQMPGLQGQDLIRLVHEHHPETVRILLTGHATLELARIAINQAGVFRLLEKPCSAVEIGIAIREALKHQVLIASGKAGLLEEINQQAAMAELREMSPDIDNIHRTPSGAILIEEEE